MQDRNFKSFPGLAGLATWNRRRGHVCSSWPISKRSGIIISNQVIGLLQDKLYKKQNGIPTGPMVVFYGCRHEQDSVIWLVYIECSSSFLPLCMLPMFVKTSTRLRLGANGASLSSSFLSLAFAEGFSLSPLSGGASLQGWVEEAWPKQIDMILNLAMVCKLGGPHASLESTLKKLLQLKFAQDVRKGGCPDQARWSIPVPQTQRFHFSCKRLSRLASWHQNKHSDFFVQQDAS